MSTPTKARSKFLLKSCNPMTELEQQLTAIEANSLSFVVHTKGAWLLFCETHSTLFEKALRNKPESSVTSHLLGILTKAHIEASSHVASNASSLQAMHQVLDESLGQTHANKFEDQSLQQLFLATHLWLYLQGYLTLDFSLANDHAHNTAELISSITQQDVQALRTEFLESYYQGTHCSQVTPSRSFSPLGWLKKLLG